MRGLREACERLVRGLQELHKPLGAAWSLWGPLRSVWESLEALARLSPLKLPQASHTSHKPLASPLQALPSISQASHTSQTFGSSLGLWEHLRSVWVSLGASESIMWGVCLSQASSKPLTRLSQGSHKEIQFTCKKHDEDDCKRFSLM